MIETTVKITITHELTLNKELSVSEIDAKVRKFLESGTSDARFWELGKEFCYHDSYPVGLSISTRFEI